MNNTNFKELRAEIGDHGIVELAKMIRWIQIVASPAFAPGKVTKSLQNCSPENAEEILRDAEVQLRFAPSIIARSEAELFALSTPRFAIRCLFGEGSFLNVRRVATFCGQLDSWYTPPSTAWFYRFLWKYLYSHPSLLMRKSRCIADSFLIPPKSLSDKYFMVTAPLSKAHGERAPHEEDLNGTIYVKHTHAGGGLCAQATCFMATALLPDHAKGVHGVAEVTALARHRESTASTLSLNGLSQMEYQNYFTHPEVNLGGLWQAPLISEDIANLGSYHPSNTPSIIAFAKTLAAYIRSGFPVIMPLDVGRMDGRPHPDGLELPPHVWRSPDKQSEGRLQDPLAAYLEHGRGDVGRGVTSSILQRNGIPEPRHRPLRAGKAFSHAIIVIGCADQIDWQKDREFIFHDPLHFPFMRATASELFLSAAYDSDSSVAVFGACLPVSPAKVLMPLLSSFSSNYEVTHQPGLFAISEHLRLNGYLGVIPPWIRSSSRATEFLLTQWRHLNVAKPWSKLRLHRVQLPSSTLWLQLEKLNTFNLRGEAWVWVEWCRDRIWIWDAEKSPPGDANQLDSDAPQYLLGAFWESEGSVRVWPEPTTNSAPQNQEEQRSSVASIRAVPRDLNPALLLSYSLRGLESALANLPPGATFCELYCFMQKDARLWMPAPEAQQARVAALARVLKSVPPGIPYSFPMPIAELSAYDRMAALADNMERIVAVAKQIHDTIARTSSGRDRALEIIGISSYFPGLANKPNLSSNRTAIRAAQFLIRLAKEIRMLGHEKLSIVEMVAGSLIQGICPPFWPLRRGDDRQDFRSHIIADDTAVHSLVESLRVVARTIRAEDLGCKIAVEFEPGPLNVLGNIKRLKMFTAAIAGDKQLKELIGINLDVAHFAFIAVQL